MSNFILYSDGEFCTTDKSKFTEGFIFHLSNEYLEFLKDKVNDKKELVTFDNTILYDLIIKYGMCTYLDNQNGPAVHNTSYPEDDIIMVNRTPLTKEEEEVFKHKLKFNAELKEIVGSDNTPTKKESA